MDEMIQRNRRASLIALTLFFNIILASGLSGYYIWQGALHGFDRYLPVLASCLWLDGLAIFALIFKVSYESRERALVPFLCSLGLILVCSVHLAALAGSRTWAIGRDEDDARTKTQSDDRHGR